MKASTYPLDLREMRLAVHARPTLSKVEDLLSPLGALLAQTRSGKWQLVLGLFRRDVKVPRMQTQSRAAHFFAVERIGRAEAAWIVDTLDKLEQVAEQGRFDIKRHGTVLPMLERHKERPWCLHIVVRQWRALCRYTCPDGELEKGEPWRELEPWAEDYTRRVMAVRAPSC